MTLTQTSSETVLQEALEIARIAAPPFLEAARATAVEARMVGIDGWSVRRDEAGNVIARTGPEGPGAVWAIAHLDTVFGPEEELRFERNGDWARGPGIGDNALAVAALLALAREATSWRLSRPLVFVFSVGEEGLGNLRGVRALLEAGEARQASAVLAVEGHRGDELGTTAVGSLRYRARASGLGGHSWSDRDRPSALHALIDLAAGLLRARGEIGGDLSINIGTLSGGTYVTAIAAEATMTFEARSTSMTALQRFEETLARLSHGGPLPIEVEELGRRPGGVLPPEHPLIAAAQAARRAHGLAPAALVANSTDANPFISEGLPALAIGLTNGRNAHHPSEEIQVSPIAQGVAVLRTLLLDLAGRGSLNGGADR